MQNFHIFLTAWGGGGVNPSAFSQFFYPSPYLSMSNYIQIRNYPRKAVMMMRGRRCILEEAVVPLNSHSFLYPTPRMCHSSSCLRHVFTAKHKKMSGHSMCDQLRRYFKWKWLHKEFLSVLTNCLFWCVGVGFDYDLTHSKFSLILISRKISSNSLLLSKIFPAIGQMIPFQRHSWNVNWGCSRLPPTHKKVFFYKKYCIL